MILAVFLVGLGIGSTVGAELARRVANPRLALGWCQLLLCGAIAWAGYTTGSSMSYWPINPSLATDISYTIQLDLMRAIWVIVPGALLWGASFPLALAAAADRQHDPAILVGGVYAANTVGAIVGAIGTSLFLIGRFGSQFAQQALDQRGAAVRIADDGSDERRDHAPGAHGQLDHRPRRGAARDGRRARRAAAAGVAGRARPLLGDLGQVGVPLNQIIYVGEGVTAAVAVTRTPSGDAQLPQRRQDPGVERAPGHAPAAHAGPHHDAGAREPGESPRDRVRGRRHGGRRVDRSAREGPDHRRDRAARPASRVHAFCPAQLRRGPESEGPHSSRRCAALPAHDR